MQISAANLLIASSQGKPAPKAEPAQSFSAALASGDVSRATPSPDNVSDEFAPLTFKSVEMQSAAPLAQKSTSPYGAPVALGSNLNIVI